MLILVIFGASGHLALTKTVPSLYRLYLNGMLDKNSRIIGYARTKMETEQFVEKVSNSIQAKFKVPASDVNLERFLNLITYFSGMYDSPSDFSALEDYMLNISGQKRAKGSSNQIDAAVYYLAIPPELILTITTNIKGVRESAPTTYPIRIAIEKPFGSDYDSAAILVRELDQLFTESEIYRIDHYLGKEMVKNIHALRFANHVFSALWNREHISNVQITFKESFGVQGRGGYFDGEGIIRDVMQNHLIQILLYVAMDKPVSFSQEDIKTEKLRLLKSIQIPSLDDIVIGQYTRSSADERNAYTDDNTVPSDSLTPTYASLLLRINNERWHGVPFLLKCGKGLNETKAEVRIQFRQTNGSEFLNGEVARNELVIRIQPGESIYFKINTKKPGFSNDVITSELDLSYSQRFTELYIPDAYESILLDIIRGDRTGFVGNEELLLAWKLLDTILHGIDDHQIKLHLYPFGSRGPPEADNLVKRAGYSLSTKKYTWPKTSLTEV